MKDGMPFGCRIAAGLTLAVLSVIACNTNTTGNGDPCVPRASSGGPTTVSYADDIVPLFTAAGCLTSACHGGDFPSSRYDLRTYESTFGIGDDARQIDACEIAPGDPESSFLLEKISNSDPRVGLQMPLEREPLTAAEIALVETWIEEGAQDN